MCLGGVNGKQGRRERLEKLHKAPQGETFHFLRLAFCVGHEGSWGGGQHQQGGWSGEVGKDSSLPQKWCPWPPDAW